MKDFSGIVIGKLTITTFKGKENKINYWNVVCECGNETKVSPSNITSGLVKSCGRVHHEPTIHSKETREKISKAVKGKYRGANNHNWKGGIKRRDTRNDVKYREFAYGVHKINNFTCQHCLGYGSGIKLDAHHLISYQEESKRYDIENGVTLCKKCHTKFHQKYCYHNFTPDNYYEYINQEKAA